MAENYGVGDHIIDLFNIYEITSLSYIDGNKEDILVHYVPLQGTDKIFTASIPQKNLRKSGLRKLMTPQEIKIVLSKLLDPVKENYNFNLQLIKESLYQNSPEESIIPLKYLWKNSDKMPKNILDMKEEMINHLCLEISFVTHQTYDSVRKSIEKNLNR